MGKRIGHNAWQFPQGGIDRGETPIDAMYRELWEEVGLHPRHVDLLAVTQDWLRYRLPETLCAAWAVSFVYRAKTKMVFAALR